MKPSAGMFEQIPVKWTLKKINTFYFRRPVREPEDLLRMHSTVVLWKPQEM